MKQTTPPRIYTKFEVINAFSTYVRMPNYLFLKNEPRILFFFTIHLTKNIIEHKRRDTITEISHCEQFQLQIFYK